VGRVQETHPNPRDLAVNEELCEKGMEEFARGSTVHGEKHEVAGEEKSIGGGAFGDEARAWARAAWERRKENCPTHTPGCGLNVPAAGSPEALNVAPDASGDHRTHAQRGL